MHPTRNHFLPPDPEAFKRDRPSRGRVIVIAPTRAACETIELALGLTGWTPCWNGSTAPSSVTGCCGGKGFGIVAGTGTGKTLGDPADGGVDPRRVAAGRRGQPRAGGHAGDADLERGHRHHRHCAAVVPGRPDHPARHGGGGRDPPDLRRTRALPGPRQARRGAVSSGSAPPWIRRSTRSISTARTCWRRRPSTRRSRATVRVESKQAEEFLDERFMRHLIQQQRGVAVFVPTRREVEQLAADLGARYPQAQRRVLPRRRADPRHPPIPRGGSPKPFLLAMTAAGQSASTCAGSTRW